MSDREAFERWCLPDPPSEYEPGYWRCWQAALAYRDRTEMETICGACQILDVTKQEWGESWSEWDQSIRDGLSKMQRPLPAPPEEKP